MTSFTTASYGLAEASEGERAQPYALLHDERDGSLLVHQTARSFGQASLANANICH